MKIQTFTVKAKVTEDKEVTLELNTKVLSDNGDDTSFDESKIALKAQEVAEHNNQEKAIIAEMGPGDYTIDYKLIV